MREPASSQWSEHASGQAVGWAWKLHGQHSQAIDSTTAEGSSRLARVAICCLHLCHIRRCLVHQLPCLLSHPCPPIKTLPAPNLLLSPSLHVFPLFSHWIQSPNGMTHQGHRGDGGKVGGGGVGGRGGGGGGAGGSGGGKGSCPGAHLGGCDGEACLVTPYMRQRGTPRTEACRVTDTWYDPGPYDMMHQGLTQRIISLQKE